ncbi:hypothetical protein JCM4814A_94290 [Streptomyces phaeofaciens JCM 4814]|uniref:Uncharacterized protein n=1 Tax=Streptomyces phaeofaciens TaxID=68254 RepID=A0A918HR90_9ACTN|nr:hypothetical protein [Streptomyces phaeofaciens]GGT99657.1 hypothetical protein GCM10010226_90920 [Streptomyces phaeofaciens]
MAAISVVLDHTTAAALYDPKDPFNETVAAFYVQASGGAPVLSLTASDAELLGYVKGLRFIRIAAFDTDAAVTATGLLRFGHSWAAVHAARPSVAHLSGRFLLTLTPKAYAGTSCRPSTPASNRPGNGRARAVRPPPRRRLPAVRTGPRRTTARKTPSRRPAPTPLWRFCR